MVARDRATTSHRACHLSSYSVSGASLVIGILSHRRGIDSWQLDFLPWCEDRDTGCNS